MCRKCMCGICWTLKLYHKYQCIACHKRLFTQKFLGNTFCKISDILEKVWILLSQAQADVICMYISIIVQKIIT